MKKDPRYIVITDQKRKEIEYQAILSGIKATMVIFNQVMKDDFGYGKVRLDRIENAIKTKLGVE